MLLSEKKSLRGIPPGAKCRLFEERDRQALVELCRSKSLQLGKEFWLPELDDQRTHLVFVMEAEGEVKGALIFRTSWDMMLIADNPEAVAIGFANEWRIREVLRRNDVDVMNAWVPKVLMPEGKKKPAMQRFMERLGFRRLDDFVSFEGEVTRG